MDSEQAQPPPFFSLDPVELDIGFGAPRPQSRVTVAFRLLLSLPHVVVLFFLGLPAFPLLVVGWFAALILGRLPRWIARYQIAVLRYSIRINAYQHMLVNEFPPFSLKLDDYPLRIEIGASRLSRLKVLFRLLLAIPANFVAGLATFGLLLFSPIIWIVTLVLGRMPQPMFSATAAVVRYEARRAAYLALITDEYPHRLFGDGASVSAPEGAGRELRLALSAGGRRLLKLILLLGVAGIVGAIVVSVVLQRREEARLNAAALRLDTASLSFRLATDRCASGPTQFRCFEHAELTWSRAWDTFGTELSTFTFIPSEQAAAAAVAHDAHTMASALRTSSRAKTDAAHGVAFDKVRAEITQYERDLQSITASG